MVLILSSFARFHLDPQRRDPITSGCPSPVLSRWLILVALPMINRIRVMSYRQGTIVLQKLFWDLDGVTLVISGVLVVFLLSFARARRYSRLMKTWNIWLWWRGFSDLCHTICLRGQIGTLTNTSEKDAWIGLRVALHGRVWKLWWNCPGFRIWWCKMWIRLQEISLTFCKGCSSMIQQTV